MHKKSLSFLRKVTPLETERHELATTYLARIQKLEDAYLASLEELTRLTMEDARRFPLEQEKRVETECARILEVGKQQSDQRRAFAFKFASENGLITLET